MRLREDPELPALGRPRRPCWLGLRELSGAAPRGRALSYPVCLPSVPASKQPPRGAHSLRELCFPVRHAGGERKRQILNHSRSINRKRLSQRLRRVPAFWGLWCRKRGSRTRPGRLFGPGRLHRWSSLQWVCPGGDTVCPRRWPASPPCTSEPLLPLRSGSDF